MRRRTAGKDARQLHVKSSSHPLFACFVEDLGVEVVEAARSVDPEPIDKSTAATHHRRYRACELTEALLEFCELAADVFPCRILREGEAGVLERRRRMTIGTKDLDAPHESIEDAIPEARPIGIDVGVDDAGHEGTAIHAAKPLEQRNAVNGRRLFPDRRAQPVRHVDISDQVKATQRDGVARTTGAEGLIVVYLERAPLLTPQIVEARAGAFRIGIGP